MSDTICYVHLVNVLKHIIHVSDVEYLTSTIMVRVRLGFGLCVAATKTYQYLF